MSVDEVVQRFGAVVLSPTAEVSRHFEGVVWRGHKDSLAISAEGVIGFEGITLAQAALLDDPWVEVRERVGGETHWCGNVRSEYL